MRIVFHLVNHTACDPEAEKVAEANGWETECGMSRHTPAGSKKVMMQKMMGCDPKEKICGIKISADKLKRLVEQNRNAFLAPTTNA